MRATHVLFGFAFLSFGGCGASELDLLRARAAFDFDCPAQTVKIKNLDDEGEAYGVSGCGKRAVYLYVCGDLGDCKWVMDSARQ